jgi:hypothetical protein
VSEGGQNTPAGPPLPGTGPDGDPGTPAAQTMPTVPMTPIVPAMQTTAGEAEPASPAGPPRPGRMRRYRVAFRGWRHSRPFWGGLLVLLGGGEILLTYRAPFGLVVHFGLYGLAGFLVPALLAVLGLLILFDPQHRTFYAVLAVLASLGTWLTSNLGGFFIGMLLGLVGGSLAFGWQYGEKPARRRRRIRARARATG